MGRVRLLVLTVPLGVNVGAGPEGDTLTAPGPIALNRSPAPATPIETAIYVSSVWVKLLVAQTVQGQGRVTSQQNSLS